MELKPLSLKSFSTCWQDIDPFFRCFFDAPDLISYKYSSSESFENEEFIDEES